jgi:Flp pilus assembly secretin CpaC
MEMVLTDMACQKRQVELAPIVTPELVKRLAKMKFDGDNVKDLAKGM